MPGSSLRGLLASPAPLPERSLLAAHALLTTSGLAADTALLAHFARHLASARGRQGDRSYSAFRALLLLRPRCAHPFNALISHLTHAGDPSAAFRAFALLLASSAGAGPRHDGYTLPAALKACARLGRLREGSQAHTVAEKAGFLGRIPVQNALVMLYGACGQPGDARRVFDEMTERDVVSWTALLSVFTRGGMFAEALEVLREMDVTPNEGTLASTLVACGRLGMAHAGKAVHGWYVKREKELSPIVGNALLDMYVKCEKLDLARRVFDMLLARDIVSWTVMISGSVQCKRSSEALELFNAMQTSGVKPDKVVLSTVLSACASLGALESGRWVHEYIERKGIEWDVHVGTSVVDMYVKCGCLDTAVSIFQKMPLKNVSSWNALINGFALHGRGREALDCFDRMVASGLHPNEVTFITVLGACCHSGLVQKGRQLFELMTKSYKLSVWEEHYGCMVDLLGRAGLIQEAYDVIKAMPMRPSVLTWGALLSACQAHGWIDFSQQILTRVHELEPSGNGVYVLLSNVYAVSDRWADVRKVRGFMNEKGMQKEPGSSVIEVNGKTCEFLVGQQNHLYMDDVCAMLSVLMKQIYLNGSS
ncbi:pentatricopeptide repeat-containing protein At4g38010-like [Oryza brachyantha]|uniref:Pentatricopeptide repeat-containing protein n=1 Tax=Oryza brachyantha TaxID=4533 RepID=J3LZ36_ORYBR|nr:pentatricopeptide repeat-containing protein At4g38010-like [Oryza brachyantha]